MAAELEAVYARCAGPAAESLLVEGGSLPPPTPPPSLPPTPTPLSPTPTPSPTSSLKAQQPPPSDSAQSPPPPPPPLPPPPTSTPLSTPPPPQPRRPLSPPVPMPPASERSHEPPPGGMPVSEMTDADRFEQLLTVRLYCGILHRMRGDYDAAHAHQSAVLTMVRAEDGSAAHGAHPFPGRPFLPDHPELFQSPALQLAFVWHRTSALSLALCALTSHRCHGSSS